VAESTKSGRDAANLCTETVSTVWYCSIMEKPGSANSSSELRGDYTHADARYTVPQENAAYTDAEHDRWRRLYARQVRLAEKHAARAFRDGLARLDCADGIPDFERASRILDEATGWRIVAVPGFIPDEVFFDHLANRRFPVTRWIREEHELDYLVEPDVFHDFFGHVPMLLDPTFADFMAAYGAAGARAQAMDAVPMLARIYWYTVEFGLIEEGGALRAYGAGIVSSAGETVFSTTDPDVLRVRMDPERIMRTAYRIDDFQDVYFVIDDLQQLMTGLVDLDFGPIYTAYRDSEPFAPGQLLDGDTQVPISISPEDATS
jgi:phenylalanine-4-hydroxylase